MQPSSASPHQLFFLFSRPPLYRPHTDGEMCVVRNWQLVHRGPGSKPRSQQFRPSEQLGGSSFFFFSYFLKIFAPRVGGAALLLDPSPFSRRDLQLSPSTNGYTQPTGENNTVGGQQPTTNKIKTTKTKTNESRCIENITTGKIGDFELSRRETDENGRAHRRRRYGTLF